MAKNKELNKVKTIEELAEKLLALMGTKAKVVAVEDKENEAIRIKVDSKEETGLLIGHHGETLSSFQILLGMMIKQLLGEWIRIVVDVGDWREKQEEHLKELAVQASERAKQTGEPQPLYNLTAAQRRIIHIELSKDPKIITESTGEGENRYLIIRCK